jgi:asparagine synthase (glutamine-hydrolysing)
MPAEQIGTLLTTAAQRSKVTGPRCSRHPTRSRLTRFHVCSADASVYLPDDILVKVDRASMLNSLEVRCPFLDHHFLELMASVPPAMRITRGQGKALLKRALHGLLPARVLQRPKMGFAVPLESWFADDLASFVRTVLLDRCTAERGIFAGPALEKLIHAQKALP